MGDRVVEDPRETMDRLGRALKECSAKEKALRDKLPPRPSGVDGQKDDANGTSEVRAYSEDLIGKIAESCREEKLSLASTELLQQRNGMTQKLTAMTRELREAIDRSAQRGEELVETRKALAEAQEVGTDNACLGIELNDALAVAKRQPFSFDPKLVEQRELCFKRNGGKGYIPRN